MSTATHAKTNSSPFDGANPYQFDAAFEQMMKFNEQFAAVARKAGTLYIDAYEKAADRAIDLESKAADLARPEWLEALLRAHTDATRELTATYASTARTLLK
jgi:hypothetical protein